MTSKINDNDFEGNFNKGKGTNENKQKYMKNLRLKEKITQEERTTLLQKVKLNDGSMSDVVSCYRHLNSWKYICNLCLITSGNWKDFKSHIFGRKHSDIMNELYHPKKSAFMRNGNRNDNPAKSYERERQFNFSKVKPLMEIDFPHKFENKRTFNDQCKDATPKTTDTVGIDRSDIVMKKDRLYGAGEISHSYPTEDVAESSSLARAYKSILLVVERQFDTYSP
uniref:U1-type domain-containing protein n=1 Tax=Clastoptera arizonana TaxID=38151 RepID=A0A1B6C0J9_9HEMI